MINRGKRASGILLPVFSLPSRYGIGTFGKAAYAFVDWLKDAKQSFWQILPLCMTSYGDSPYQSFSTFAGNPYFIDLEPFIEEGLLTRACCSRMDWGKSPQYVDYEKQYKNRYRLLRKAYSKSLHREKPEYSDFLKQQSVWLDDFCLYMSLKQRFNQHSWLDWPENYKFRRMEAMDEARHELQDEMDFQRFLQYTFFKQWFSLKEYANRQGIKIIGDLPIYVAMDSADAWVNPKLFQFDERLNPTHVAGVPPDYFSEDGQLWGNPLYNWPAHKATDYEWWIRRIAHTASLYDTVRIDHFRGFAEYWAVPYGSKTARKGKWNKGPGAKLFAELKHCIGETDIIAEDLGVRSRGLDILLKKTGYPGMKVLQFAFSAGQDSLFLPHNYPKECIVYTGTHDNATTLEWYKELLPDDKKFVNQYCRVPENADFPVFSMIETAFQSIAELVIIPLQDYLLLGAEARINIPSTLGGNWTWRLLPKQLDKSLQKKIAAMTKIYFRDRSADVEQQ